MNSIKADVMDYIGKHKDGVIVLLSINCDENFSEGTLYYSDKILALTVDDTVEKEIGTPIELWEGYRELIVSILKKVVPYKEIINRLDEVDFSKYLGIELESTDGEDVDIDDVKIENTNKPL